MRIKLSLIFIILLAMLVVQASEKEDVWKPIKKIVFRQFHVEGFIIQYILDDISVDGKTLVFNSEQIENGPPGLKAKLTFKFIDNNTIEESFHLAFPGQDFSCYITNFLKRKK